MAPLVTVDDRAVQSSLKQARREYQKAARKGNRVIGDEVAATAKGRAAAGTREQSAAMLGIRGGSTSKDATVVIRNLSAIPFALAAFMGTKAHSGWYAKPRYWDGPPQHPRFVGNQYDIGSGGGPYAVAPAVREHLPGISNRYRKECLEALRDANLPIS